MNKKQVNKKRTGLPGGKIPRKNRCQGAYRRGPTGNGRETLENLPKEIAKMFY